MAVGKRRGAILAVLAAALALQLLLAGIPSPLAAAEPDKGALREPPGAALKNVGDALVNTVSELGDVPAKVKGIADDTLKAVREALVLPGAEPVAVTVEGIEGEALKNVREALAIPEELVRDGKVDREWLDRFSRQARARAQAAMEPFGFYQARIAVTTEEEPESRIRIRLKVDPGEPVRLQEVKVSINGPGAQEPALKRLAAAFPLAQGERLVQPKYEEAKGELLLLAQDLGYLDADFTVHEIRISPTLSTARIALEMETGRKYSFSQARIEGAPDYPEPFLRRYLAFAPGETFSYARLGETQLNFMNSERFREVNVSPEKELSAGDQVPVVVQLTPGPSRSLRQGVGYGTDTGARFNLRYRDLNVLDQGHEFYSNLYLSERLQGLATGYILPDAKDIRSSTVLQLNLQKADVTTYTSRVVALELDRNHSLGRNELATAYVKVQWEAYTIGSQESSARLVLPGLRYAGNFYDNPTRPGRGFRFLFDIRGTHRALGADTGLLQVISEGSHILPLPWRLSLHSRVKAGLTLLSDPLSDLPPSLRFFAGGDQSVRGYAYQSLGPRDASGQVTGGKHLIAGSVEIERAFFDDWGVSLFYDTGNAFDSFTQVRLAQGAGLGLHYYTHVGALNLSLARRIGEDDPGFRIHFTVGFDL